MLYRVLQTLGPDDGTFILPGAIVDESVVTEASAPILIALGVIEPLPTAPTPEQEQ